MIDLVDFVYQWIGNFFFDLKTYSVKQLDAFDKEKSDNLRLQLLIGLQTMKPSKMWECNLFVEFLEVSHTHFTLTIVRIGKVLV